MKRRISLDIVDAVDAAIGSERWLLNFVLGQIYVESSFDPKADSGYARGLMQVSKVALEDYNMLNNDKIEYADMYDIWNNVHVGVWYLKQLIKKYEREYARFGAFLALVAYNVGQGNVDTWRFLDYHDIAADTILSGCLYAMKCIWAANRVHVDIEKKEAYIDV